MKKFVVFLSVVFALPQLGAADQPTTAPSTQPATPASQQLLADTQKRLLTVSSIQADFVQKKKLALLKHTLTLRGHFAMEKPDKFVWSVTEPEKYAIRVSGEEITQWDEDTNKVSVFHASGDPTFKGITDQIQAWFLGDYKSLEQNYDVFMLSEKPLSLRFVPRSNSMVAKLLKNIEILFGEDGLAISQMTINEASGDLSVLNYSNIRINQPVPTATWEIPPK